MPVDPPAEPDVRYSGPQMTYKESFGLYIRSDGPNGSGNYQTDGDLNLYIKGKATDAIEFSTTEGIKHFNNWEAGLSSLQTVNKERFEFTQATKYMDYVFNADQVKIVDDVALISYPDYTDVSKVVWQHQTGGIYNPRVCISYYDTGATSCGPLIRGSLFPLISIRVLEEAGITGNYENLVILIEYDGYYSNAAGNIAYDAALVGKKELFTYSYGNVNGSEPSKFYFLNGVTDRFMVLNSKFDKPLGPGTFNPATDPRLLGTQVTKDLDIIYTQTTIVQQITDLYRQDYSQNNMYNYTTSMGFLGYSKISIIKYATAKKCGKVDLYLRKTGTVSSVVSSGVISSPYNDLQTGDIIKINGALTSSGVDTNFNGVKYVQIADTNNLSLYDDSTFLTNTDTSSYVASSNATWTLIGNLYDNNRQGWSYKKTLLSPSGPNGYSRSGTYGSESLVGLPITYQYVPHAVALAILDLQYDLTLDTALDPYSSNLAVRNRVSNLDSLWANDDHFVTDCRFGSGIDIKKNGSSYRIVIGEQGPDTFVDFEKVFHIPNISPYGKVYDFNLSIDSTKTFTLTLTNTINASTGTSGVIMTPPEMYQSCASSGRLFYDATQIGGSLRADTSTSQSYNTVTPVYVCYPYTLNTGYITSQYWYGAMLYHVPSRFSSNTSDNDYFSDMNLCYLPFGSSGFNTCTIPFYNYYPYVDNFGKSVALNLVNGKWILAAGSTTKTDLTNKSSTSCGPIHIFDITASPSSVQRINYTNAVTTPSRCYASQKNRARRFGKCIKTVDDTLAIGCSKPHEAKPTYTFFTNETSSILIYKYINNIYGLDSQVLNTNNFNDAYTTSTTNADNYKEFVLRNGIMDYISYSSGGIYPSDRFGDCFDYDGKIIITNAFDIKNDSGVSHSDLAFPDSLCDYLHIYERTNQWNFIAKISASIDSSQSKYDYSNIQPYNYVTLRSLGNKNYENGTTNSVTWDIDLTNCYTIADDRIILKDPLGYGIFTKNWPLSTYSCSTFRVTTFVNYTRQTNSNGRTRYTNPLIAIGKSFVASQNSSSTSAMNGTNLPSNQIITIDDLELSISSVPLSSRMYQEVRSFDINRLDYLSLYMCNNIQTTNNINLSLISNIPISGNMNLYINQLGSSSGIPLYIENASASGDMPLFINQIASLSSDIPLYIQNNVETVTGQTNLYIENTINSNFMPLYMKSGDILSTNATINIYGGINESYNINNGSDLYINGGLISYADNTNAPIFISGLDVGVGNGDMPLFINNVVDSGNVSGNMSIYIQNTDITDINYIKKNNKVNLFLNATYGLQDNMPLVLFRTGIDGQEVEGMANLVIGNQTPSDNLNLSINSLDRITGDVNLFLPCGTGNGNQKIDTFIRGYQE